MMGEKAANARLQAGFALLIVLWTLSLLALLGTQLVAAGRVDAQLARNLLDGATLEAAADGAVQQAIFRLLDRPERRWAADGTEHVIRVGQAVVAVRLEDEGGKVNPNIASEALLQALLVRVGTEPAMAAALAAAIVDWRTASRQPRPRGAKAPQYAAAGLDYGPPESDFRSIDELGAVLGMTSALLTRLRPHVTVFSEADPDGATRDPVVAGALLTALGRVPAAVTGGVQVASVIALAKGAERSAFAERAIVRINAQTDRHPYELLALERIANPGGFSGN
jgi:general secretion pathway protein K